VNDGPGAVPDHELVKASRGGDQGAFAELVRRHRDSVFRLSVSILGDGFVGDAEEVAQEVFLRAHHGLRSFRGDAQFGTWVYRIAFNLALNTKSRVRYRASHLTEDALAGHRAPGGDPLAQLEVARRKQLVCESISQLPDVYQAALRLHYWLDTSVADIALMLDVPENTVKSYLHRARKLLSAMLAEKGVSDG
jgi:RNA polymerase sigma-70 factor, ECF subfamily